MSGTFVCVVGPSGAGKDTLIDGARMRLADDSRFVFPRRLVTRAASGAEDHHSLSMAEFRARQERDDFAVSWTAHGLGYGIPGSVRRDVEQGLIAVCNLSRAAISSARARFPHVRVALVTAPREVLSRRLQARGRETVEDVDARLDRESLQTMPSAELTIVNVGVVDDRVDDFVGFLQSSSVVGQTRVPVDGLAFPN